MSKKRYEWVFENGENEIIDNLAGRYVTISSPELLNEKDEKISDLEAKLAEKEESIKWLVEAEWNRKWANKYIEMRRKEDPKLLFPDSDEVYEHYFIQQDEIKRLTKMLEDYEHDIDEAHKLDDIYAEKLRQRHKDYEQLKISFAVEQLKFLKNEIEMIGHIPKYTVLPERELICRFDVFRLIDNQIKQLKEMT